MLVMILEKAPTGLRGALSRWLLELKPGVFLGNPTARVRDELWTKACQKIKDSNVIQVWTARNAQGFEYRQFGLSFRFLQEFEGMALVTIVRKPLKQVQCAAE